MRVAVIIPTLDDAESLAGLLSRLTHLNPVADELIVVGGTASCELACRSAGAVWVAGHTARGGQLALGAARARADVLWFLRTDCEPHSSAVAALCGAVQAGAAGGYFRFRFAGPRTRIKHALERCIGLRARIGTVYGDQGLFVTRAAYEATPGFTLQPLFEEVALVRALKRTGRFVALPLPLAVSAHRWECEGFLRRALADRLLVLAFMCGVAPARLARWRGARAQPAPAGYGRRRDTALRL
ncbi:MAG TPA: hypothetical protein VMG11_03960 [Steroidobacteraceae bacterium]|nr:hypothetical protein [Steroidobacteraceae bacterium]